VQVDVQKAVARSLEYSVISYLMNLDHRSVANRCLRDIIMHIRLTNYQHPSYKGVHQRFSNHQHCPSTAPQKEEKRRTTANLDKSRL